MTHVLRFSGVFFLLASAAAASAQPAHVAGFASISSEIHAIPVSSFTHSRALLWGSGDDDDHDNNHDGDHERDRDRDKDHDRDRDHDKDHDHSKGEHGPKPTPEPSTLMSFGAALLIGGGVMFSRRLRKNK